MGDNKVDNVQKVNEAIGESLSKIGTITAGVANGEVDVSTELTQWKETFHLQDTLNKVIDPDWKLANRNWPRAIRGEMFEAIDSFNWEWWKRKKNTPNIPNAEIEMVDTFFFLLSHSITFAKTERDFNNLCTTTFTLALAKEQRVVQNEMDVKFNQEEFIKNGEDFIKFSLVSPEQYHLMFLKFMDMWLSLNLKMVDLMKLYRTKNILNLFRQQNGYKEGTYVKIWGEEEDNIICFGLAKRIPLDDNFQTTLMNELKIAYANFI